MIELKQYLEVAGLFRLIVRRPDGSIRVDTDWFTNMIVNQGLDKQMDSGGSADLLSMCRVGSGSTPPAATDTSLVSQVATTTTINASVFGTVTSSPWYAWKRKTFRFATGVAAGNLTEVGISSNQAGNPLISRALIVDGGGSPITITVLSDETLDVVYEYRVYPLQADLPFNVTISAVNYSCVCRASSLGDVNALARNVGLAFTFGNDQFGNGHRWSAYTGALGPITGVPGGTAQTNGIDPSSASAYVTGTFTRSITVNWSLNNGNLAGGIAAVQIPMSIGWYQVSFSPVIPKDNTKILALTMTYLISRRVI